MINAASENDVICTCSGTTQQQMQALIAQGYDTLEKLSRHTGACSGCGACEPDIMLLLREDQKTEGLNGPLNESLTSTGNRS